jgi:hypothetical protein
MGTLKNEGFREMVAKGKMEVDLAMERRGEGIEEEDPDVVLVKKEEESTLETRIRSKTSGINRLDLSLSRKSTSLAVVPQNILSTSLVNGFPPPILIVCSLVFCFRL